MNKQNISVEYVEVDGKIYVDPTTVGEFYKLQQLLTSNKPVTPNPIEPIVSTDKTVNKDSNNYIQKHVLFTDKDLEVLINYIESSTNYNISAIYESLDLIVEQVDKYKEKIIVGATKHYLCIKTRGLYRAIQNILSISYHPHSSNYLTVVIHNPILKVLSEKYPISNTSENIFLQIGKFKFSYRSNNRTCRFYTNTKEEFNYLVRFLLSLYFNK